MLSGDRVGIVPGFRPHGRVAIRRHDPPLTAIVVPSAAPNGYAVIRSLTARGISVVALDHHRTPLCWSRLCRFEVVPDPDGDPKGFIDALAGIADRLARPVLFATEDLHVTVIHQYRERLESRVRFPFMDFDAVLDCVDKRRGLARAREAGIAVPRTFAPGTPAELDAQLPALDRYPYVVKPAGKFEWARGRPVRNREFFRTYGTKGLRTRDRKELRAVFGDAVARGYTVLVQEEIEGPADRLVAIDFYVDAAGRVRARHIGRKLRQQPNDFGTCTLGCTCRDPRLPDLCRDYVRVLGFRGIGNLEFKERRGKLFLMEINPRPWMWLLMATASGVNLPLLAAEDLAGLSPSPADRVSVPRRWIDLRTDARHLTANGNGLGRVGIRAWLRTLRPLPVEARVTPADPMPPIYAVAAALWRRLSRGERVAP